MHTRIAALPARAVSRKIICLEEAPSPEAPNVKDVPA